MSSATDLTTATDDALTALGRVKAAGGAVVAELAAAKSDVVDLTQDLNESARLVLDLRDVNGELVAKVAEKDAEIVRLQAIIDGEEEPPDPEPASTLFGSSFGIDPGRKVPLGRSYLQPGERPTSWQADSGMRKGVEGTLDGGVLWISPKVSDADWLVPFAASLHAGLKLMVSPWHEPENDDTSGHNLTDYTNAYKAFAPVCKQVGATLLPVLMKSKDEALNRRYLDAARPYISALGFDAYNGGIQNPKTYQDPAVVFEKPLRLAAEYGLDLWIAETGSGLVAGDSGAGRDEWTEDVRAFAIAKKIRGLAWWNAARCALTSSTAARWFGN